MPKRTCGQHPSSPDIPRQRLPDALKDLLSLSATQASLPPKTSSRFPRRTGFLGQEHRTGRNFRGQSRHSQADRRRMRTEQHLHIGKALARPRQDGQGPGFFRRKNRNERHRHSLSFRRSLGKTHHERSDRQRLPERNQRLPRHIRSELKRSRQTPRSYCSPRNISRIRQVASTRRRKLTARNTSPIP